MLENNMVISRASDRSDPQNAVDETRPENCTCTYQTEDMNWPEAAEDHDPSNERCPLFECPECDHAKLHHGSQGCEFELGDRYSGKEYEEAGGMCQCPLTPQDIEHPFLKK